MVESTSKHEERAEEVRWNLGVFYTGPDDPRIEEEVVRIDQLVEGLQGHRTALSRGIDARALAEILAEFEEFRIRADRLHTYAALGASAHQDDPKRRALHGRIAERSSLWQARSCFIELMLRRMDDAALRSLAADPALRPYRHFLLYQATLAPHTLTEEQEQVILKKNIAGRDAMERFRDEVAACQEFGSLLVDGEERPVTAAALLSLQEHPSPEVRRAARERLNETFARNRRLYSFLYSSIVKDYGIEAEMRGFAEPLDVECVPNEIPSPLVKRLVAAARRNLPLLHDYYAFKAGKLGVSRLRTCDLMAPYPGVAPTRIPWTVARQHVERAIARLDEGLVADVRAFFDEQRLDAGARTGKRGGAFCAPVPRGKPFILLGYTGTWNSVVTLAHELGHGIHFTLSGASQTYLQAFRMSKVMAETASEFSECLLRDHLLEHGADTDLKKALHVAEVERFINVVYRQLFFTEFEMEVHRRSAKEALSAETLSEIWVSMAKEHYGPHVELLESDEIGWSLVGHFVFNPFYCYSYAMSQIVVLALYRRWRREGESFRDRYLDLLRAGSDGSPEELLRGAGIDLGGPEVIDGAFDEFRERVRAARAAIG